MERIKVAVIGAGPTGLSMLKTLTENGFAVTLYERRSQVGGIWAYTKNPSWTTALKSTQANVSKYTCGFSDFPMPDKYPSHMNVFEWQEYMEDYARHFDVLKQCVLNTSVHKVHRNTDDTRWVLELGREGGKRETAEYDRIAVCNGYETKACVPKFEGQELFEGTIMHAQQFRDPEPFKDKKVVVLGLCSSSGDIIPTLMPVASRVWVSHRRGSVFIRRFRNGTPVHLPLTWRYRTTGVVLEQWFPSFARFCGDLAVKYLSRSMLGGKPDPAWGIEPYPSPSLILPGVWERVLPFLQDGSLTSLKGLTKFVGPKSIEFADGTVLDDVDTVILATGYEADFSLLSEVVERSRPNLDWYQGPDMYRLWMNLFPPRWADSVAVLNYSTFGRTNGFSFADMMSMAISSAWQGIEPFPSIENMECHVDEHQRWIAKRWRIEPNTPTSAVKPWEFQGWLHRAAGTGMENLGWGWKGWKFWWQDREMYKLMKDGVETVHMYRFFETDRRQAWPGSRNAIVHVNEVVQKTFPLPTSGKE
ncbi:dimethylaniline monooxygenase [Penicillium taxi]|uniref:dimethylaniline monooxygenase n=1 Tax=Penicillium taxi TaxID=168475 RepID=UPI002545284E|nr:dimethylaniline monooxygenase [Penicillium taxi]KAJ5885164.1 dimethylaniline monooxygenase [Penicillium taxi]